MSPERAETWLASKPIISNIIMLANKVGVATAILLLGGFWFADKGLPMVLDALKERDNKFISALERIDDRHREAELAAQAAIRELTTEVRWINKQHN